MKYILVRDALVGEDGTIIKLDVETLKLFWIVYVWLFVIFKNMVFHSRL